MNNNNTMGDSEAEDYCGGIILEKEDTEDTEVLIGVDEFDWREEDFALLNDLTKQLVVVVMSKQQCHS